MTPENEAKLTNIFRTLFNNSSLQLTHDLSAQDVPGWDSLNHVNLIISIENEFGIRFSNTEISSLENVGQLMQLIDKKVDG